MKVSTRKNYFKIKVLTTSYTFNNSFSIILKRIGIENVPDDELNLPSVDAPISKAIAKYENNPSISRIKSYMKDKGSYISFEFVNKTKILKK